MDKHTRKLIQEKTKPAINNANNELEKNIKNLQRKLNAKGLLKSGSYCSQLNGLLLSYVKKTIDIIWKTSFSLRKSNDIKFTIDEIPNLIKILSDNLINLADEKLKHETNKIFTSHEDATRILESLKFKEQAKNIIGESVNKYENVFSYFNKEEKQKNKENLWKILSILIGVPAAIATILKIIIWVYSIW